MLSILSFLSWKNSGNGSERKLSAKAASDTIMAERQKLIGPAVAVFYPADPLVVTKAHRQYLFDQEGTRFLDCISNVQHVGHAHEEVAAAVSQQMRETTANSRFLHPSLTRVATKILNTLPSEVNNLYMCNSGSEANDLALRLAGDFTGGATEVIVVDHAYHGHLLSTIDISPYKFHGKGGKGKPSFVHICPCPDVYRGKHRLPASQREDKAKLEEAGAKYAEEVAQIIRDIQSKGKKLKCFIMEALISCGGQVIAPPGFLRRVMELVHAAGGIVIVDEVQSGFGRVGELFWAFRLQGLDIVPDIVTMGKPMGNGFPTSAVAVKNSVAKNFGGGMQYFNTFGGNPVSCAAIEAVFRIMEKEGLLKTAEAKGEFLLKGLKNLKSLHPRVIGDVRGVGLFAGIELVKESAGVPTDDWVGEPDAELAEYCILALRREHQVLVSAEGPHGNILKFKPPMCFSFDNTQTTPFTPFSAAEETESPMELCIS